ncbi:stage 0 sporulation family protein [Desulfuromonas carbonis]|uniref:PSP1 domain-containing protein n=1 Tax=Desulfuromonas sp. DDH964 TaxID=1823759 RepID=UPI00078E01A8|nr:stage 0 sporulation family protein [Desulfuromonas sp. DDH964]AMV71991.1 PSP1 superfamily protein [Desulfuromonas sp. DDH964]
MPRVVKIKFRDAGKQYDFNAQQWELRAGEQVVVETDRGRALGIVVLPPEEKAEGEVSGDLKSILRPASDEDRAMASANATRERDALRFCQQRIAERRLEMKLVRAEYLFDGSKIIFYFTADGRIDFRELVKDLAHYFHTRIEMRQIGVRDEAKLTGGIGICGRELCCCTFLTDFAPVSVKMAKEQGLALNPTKISGQCGRLLCCLAYEFETYCALRKGLPKSGRKVTVDGHDGEVTEVNVLRQKVTVRMGDGSRVQLTAEEIASGERLRPLAPGQQPTPLPDRTEPGRDRNRRERPPRRPGGDRPRPPRSGEQPETAPSPKNLPPSPPPPATAGEPAPPAEGTTAKKPRRRNRNRRRPKKSE